MPGYIRLDLTSYKAAFNNIQDLLKNLQSWRDASDKASGVKSKNEQHLREESLFSWPYPVLRMRSFYWLCMY